MDSDKPRMQNVKPIARIDTLADDYKYSTVRAQQARPR